MIQLVMIGEDEVNKNSFKNHIFDNMSAMSANPCAKLIETFRDSTVEFRSIGIKRCRIHLTNSSCVHDLFSLLSDGFMYKLALSRPSSSSFLKYRPEHGMDLSFFIMFHESLWKRWPGPSKAHSHLYPHGVIGE